MVGWKYRPGDGYVSDDDHDDGTVSTGTNDIGDLDTDFLMMDQVNRSRELDIETNSLISTAMSSIEPPARVSFQELIDDAIDIMRRLPPRKLIPLATRYYGREQVQDIA